MENEETIVQLPLKTRVANFVRTHRTQIAAVAATTAATVVILKLSSDKIDELYPETDEDLETTYETTSEEN